MAVLRVYMYSVMGLLVYIVRPGSSLFSWHPTIMTFTSMFVLYEGVALLSKNNSLLERESHTTKRNIHSLVHFFASWGLVLGFTTVAMAKFQHNLPHFDSLHSTLGGITGGFTFFQGLSGMATRFQRLSPVTEKNMIFGHTIWGIFQYLFTCLTFISGVCTDYMTKRTSPFVQLLLISLPMIAFATSSPRLLNRLLQTVLKPK